MASVRKRTWQSGDRRSFAWVVDWTDHTGKRFRRQFETRREAEAFQLEIENQLSTGAFRPDALSTTVWDLAQQYVAHLEGRWQRGEHMKRHSLKVFRGHILNYICVDIPENKTRKVVRKASGFDSGVGSLKLAHLTARAVLKFSEQLRSAGLSVPTTRKVIGTLHSMLEYGRMRDMVSDNAARRIRVYGRRDEGSKKVVSPSKEELRAVLDAAPPMLRRKILFAAITGVRAGELHALRWHHVDFKRKLLTVNTSVDQYGHEDGQGAKTSPGNREIPVGDDLLEELISWRAASRFAEDTDLIFPNSKGGYENHALMLKRQFHPIFENLVERTGANGHNSIVQFRWHALRHYAVSTWIEAGLPPKTIQTFAGHKTLQITMDTYGHFFKSGEHATVMAQLARSLIRPTGEADEAN